MPNARGDRDAARREYQHALDGDRDARQCARCAPRGSRDEPEATRRRAALDPPNVPSRCRELPECEPSRRADARLERVVALLADRVRGGRLALWTRYVPRAVTSVNGEPLGHLPAGVRAANLNLLLVTLDTTRADRIHAYGFDGIETPNLDRLAREGVLFEQRRRAGAADAAGAFVDLHR